MTFESPLGIATIVGSLCFAWWVFGPKAPQRRADVGYTVLIVLGIFGLLALTGVFSEGASLNHFMGNMDYIFNGR